MPLRIRLIFAALVLFTCQSVLAQKVILADLSRAKVNGVSLGMSAAEVLRVLGAPTYDPRFEGSSHEVWRYFEATQGENQLVAVVWDPVTNLVRGVGGPVIELGNGQKLSADDGLSLLRSIFGPETRRWESGAASQVQDYDWKLSSGYMLRVEVCSDNSVRKYTIAMPKAKPTS